MPVAVEIPMEKWTGKVREVRLGATREEGGSRGSVVTVGGESTLPFLHFEGAIPNPPAIAVEIEDQRPNWPAPLAKAWGRVMDDPVAWAQAAVAAGAKIVALTLSSASPDGANRSADQVAETVKQVLAAVPAPLIVYGPGQAEKDNEVLVRVAEVAAGERIAIGICEQSNYRTIVAGALAHGQIVIGRAPIEINIQKQLNILISDMGLPLDRVLMDPTTGALGYGLEYTYSVMERLRLAALQGDGMCQLPIICTVGYEAWRAKESKAVEGVPEAWGDLEARGIAWEVLTATTLLEAGADILVMRHPTAVAQVQQAIDRLMAKVS